MRPDQTPETVQDQSVELPKSPKNRYGWIDYARGIAITLIVFGHTGGGFIKAGAAINPWLLDICQSVYYSRMPLFFVVSGLFVQRSLAKRGLVSFARYKFSTILYPYLLWASVQLLIQIFSYQRGLANMPRTWADFARLFYDPHGRNAISEARRDVGAEWNLIAAGDLEATLRADEDFHRTFTKEFLFVNL
jgi:uncharacterized membrane protein YcfT